MLTAITGGAMSRKDAILRDEIKKSKQSGRDVLVIVPDQFSYEYDKLLYDIFGACFFNSLTVYGINRLCREIIRQNGLKNGDVADDNTKMIAMYNSLKGARIEGGISYFTRNIEKPYFAKEISTVISSLRKSGISPEGVEKASLEAQGILSGKLHDIGELYARYDKQLADKGLCDGISLTREAAVIIKEKRSFAGFDIFIDRCDTFSADEYELVSALLYGCNNMFVALTLSDENNSKSHSSPFNATVTTLSKLQDIANTLSVPFARKVSRQYYYNRQSLVHVNANIFCLENHPCSTPEGVVVAKAQDMYDEIDYCAAEIKRLVLKEGYKYSDIAVISRQLADYVPIIESAFEKYEIPTFIDCKSPASGSVLSIYIKAVADCARGKSFNTEKILRMIKSPLSPFKDFEVSALEEYCYTWGVEGAMWEAPFEVHNKKFLNIETVEDIRKRITVPIVEFRRNSSGGSAEDVIDAFVQLLDSYNLSSCANAVTKKALSMEQEKSFITEKSASVQLAREFKQVWLMFIKALRSIRENFASSSLTLKEFSEIFDLLMSDMEISNPPQRINTVTVAGAAHSRLSAVKAVFVIGANADKMPAPVTKGGLFTEKEKKSLADAGIDICDTQLQSIRNERLITYLSLTQGSDKLYVTYSLTDIKGKGLLPSSVVNELRNMFSSSVCIDISSLGVDYFCRTPRSALAKFSEILSDYTPRSETLKKALLATEETAERANLIIERAAEKPFKISVEMSQKLFFSKDNENDGRLSVTLSPSSLQKYNRCPFSYFCNYGLGLRMPVKSEMNGVNRGNLLHFVLENILSRSDDRVKVYDSSFETLTDAEIEQKVRLLAKTYLETELGGAFGKTKRFYSDYERIIKNAVYVVANIRQELSLSLFKPHAFELPITVGDSSMLVVENGEVSVRLTGTVDRLDVYRDDTGRLYIKIVDYKTGKIKNLYKSVLHGVNLQLLIYLIAILEKSELIFGKDAEAGGIVYTPAFYLSSTTTEEKNTRTEKNDDGISWEYIMEKLKRFGFVVDDKQIIDAMNCDENKYFYPSTKSSVISSLKFKALMEHTKGMVLKTATDLAKGKIAAEPLGDATESVLKKACSYCEYSSICGMKNKKPKRLIQNSDGERFDSILESKMMAMTDRKKEDKNG